MTVRSFDLPLIFRQAKPCIYTNRKHLLGSKVFSVVKTGSVSHTQPKQHTGAYLLVSGEILRDPGRLHICHHIGKQLLHLLVKLSGLITAGA